MRQPAEHLDGWQTSGRARASRSWQAPRLHLLPRTCVAHRWGCEREPDRKTCVRKQQRRLHGACARTRHLIHRPFRPRGCLFCSCKCIETTGFERTLQTRLFRRTRWYISANTHILSACSRRRTSSGGCGATEALFPICGCAWTRHLFAYRKHFPAFGRCQSGLCSPIRRGWMGWDHYALQCSRLGRMGKE